MKALKESHDKYLEETIELRESLEGGFLFLAERLKNIRDKRMYSPSYENFGEFLREINISEASASKLISVYEKFILMGGISREELSRVGWANISIFLPLVKTKEDAKRIWDETHLLDRTDAMRTYQEMKTGIDMAKCPHADRYTLEVCKACGVKFTKNEKEN